MQAFSMLEQRYLPGNPDLLDPFTRVLGIGLTQHPSESIWSLSKDSYWVICPLLDQSLWRSHRPSNYLQIRFPGNTWSENASVTHINNNKLLFFNKRQTVLQITRVIRKRRDLPPCPPTAGSIYHCFLSLMEARNVYRASHSEPRSMISPLRLSFNNSLFQLFSQFRECGKTSKHLSMVSGELRTSQVELVARNCLSM